MNVLNFGSLNIDYVYKVSEFVQPGETISCRDMKRHMGGKGLNQSVALARSKAPVWHVGVIGNGGECLLDTLSEAGVNVDNMVKGDAVQGHAIIQVDYSGENCIIVYGGSNQSLTRDFISSTLGKFSKDTIVLLQNEINDVPFIISEAKRLGMKVALNPSPISREIEELDLSLLDWLLINLTEGSALSGETDAERILDSLAKKHINTGIVLTLGGAGAVCSYMGQVYRSAPYKTSVLDTTGAGDTFTGFFIGALCLGKTIPEALDEASAAASISVSREGAAASIPCFEEMLQLKSCGRA